MVRGPESRPFVPEVVARLLFLAWLGYLSSAAMTALELVLA